MANRYLVLLKVLVNLNSQLVFEFEGKIKFIAITYMLPSTQIIIKSYSERGP
jgi:hypothetical protein